MKKYHNRVCLLSISLLGFWSCQLPMFKDAHQLENPQGSLSMRFLSARAYMGGSIFYVPEHPELGQLQKGAVIAYRLGRVEPVESEGGGIDFQDVPERKILGEIDIQEVNRDQLTGYYTRFDSQGVRQPDGRFSLALGDELDLNGDSLPDLRYHNGPSLRAGLENATYLEFLSSQVLLNTSMFSLIPQMYQDKSLPNGSLGLNPAGRMLLTKYRASGGRSVSTGVIVGDYLLDNDHGNYRVVQTRIQGRALEEDDLGEVVESVDFSEVLPLLDFEINSDIDNESDEVISNDLVGARGVLSIGDYDTEIDRLNNVFSKYLHFWDFNLGNRDDLLDQLDLKMSAPKVKMGIWAQGSITWSSLRMKLEIVGFADTGAIRYNYKGSVSSKDYFPISDTQDAPEYELIPETDVDIPFIPPFVIGPVVLGISGFAKGGVKLAYGIPNTVKLKSGFAMIIGGGVDLKAKWGLTWGLPYLDCTWNTYPILEAAVFRTAPDFSLGEKAFVSLRPYINYGARAALWGGLVFGEFGPTQGIDLTTQFTGEHADASLSLILSFDAKAGISVFGKKVQKKFTVFEIPKEQSEISHWRLF